MSKLDYKELFGEDSDDEEIIIPPMPKFKSKTERRGNIEEEIPEDIPEPEILSYKSDDSEEPTDILFFKPDESEELDEKKEEKVEESETKKKKGKEKTKCPPGKVLNPETGRCVEDTKKKVEDKKSKDIKSKEKKEKTKKESSDKKEKKITLKAILSPSVAEFVEKVISEKEPCPPGKVRNPKTGRCVKEKS